MGGLPANGVTNANAAGAALAHFALMSECYCRLWLEKSAPEDFFILEPTRIERAAPPPKPKAEKPAAQMKLI